MALSKAERLEGLDLPGTAGVVRISVYLEDLYSPQAALVDAGTGEQLGSHRGDHQSDPYHVPDAVKVYGRIGENPE